MVIISKTTSCVYEMLLATTSSETDIDVHQKPNAENFLSSKPEMM
jgi:hypothetical protein